MRIKQNNQSNNYYKSFTNNKERRNAQALIKAIKCNPQNEKIKEIFFTMLEHVKGRSPITIKHFANAIKEFEKHTNHQDFKTFKSKQAIGFKEYLSSKTNKITGEPISKSYLRSDISHLRDFFEWLSHQKGYKKYINYNDTQYFILTRNDRNKAMATNYQESYTIYEILQTIKNMPTQSPFNMRNKAMLSLTLLTTPRISALQSARIKSVKYFKQQDVWAFMQNPNTVNTKYARNITAYFIGNNQDIYNNVFNWIDHLKEQGFKDEDYLFPRFKVTFTKTGDTCLVVDNKSMIKSQTTIRNIFKNTFQAQNLPYYKPHSFRHTIVRKANELDNSSMWMSVLSPNFGHTMDSVITSSYGTVAESKRGRILKGFILS